jgi:DNA-binding transcriptional regulator YiaG
MRPQRPISEQGKRSLEELHKSTKTKADFQCVQAVWLRAALEMSSEQVALSVGLSPATVKSCGINTSLTGERC